MSTLKAGSVSVLAGRRYLEFDLDALTMVALEKLAAKAGVTPFEMGVALLRERLSVTDNSAGKPAKTKIHQM